MRQRYYHDQSLLLGTTTNVTTTAIIILLLLSMMTATLSTSQSTNTTTCKALPTMVPASTVVIPLVDVPFYSVLTQTSSSFPYYSALSPSAAQLTTTTASGVGPETAAPSTDSAALSYFEVDAAELSQGNGIIITGLEGGKFNRSFKGFVVPSLLVNDDGDLLSNASGNLKYIRLPATPAYPGFQRDSSFPSGGYVEYPVDSSAVGPQFMITVKTRLLGNLLGAADDIVVDEDWKSEEGHGFEDLISKSFGDLQVTTEDNFVALTLDSFTSYRIASDEYLYINFFNNATTPMGCAAIAPVVIRIKAYAQSIMSDLVQGLAFGVFVFGLIAVMARGSVPSSHQAGMYGILSFTHFAQEDGNALPLILSPLQASIGTSKYQYVQGALVSNVSIIAAVAGIQLAAVFYLRRVSFLPPLEAQAVVRFPSILVAVAVHLAPSTFYCVGRNLGNQNGILSYGLAFLNSAVFLLIVVALGAWKLQNPPVAFGAVRKPIEVKPVVQFQNDTAATAEQRMMSYLVQQQGEWEDNKRSEFIMERYGWIFENYSYEGRYRTVFEFFDSVLLGVLAVADNHTSTLAMIQYGIYLLVKSTLLVSLFLRNPISIPSSAVICLVSYACQVVASLALVVGSINPSIMQPAYIVRDVSLMVGILSLVADCLLTTLRHLLTFRATLQRTEEKRDLYRQRIVRDALIRLTEADLDNDAPGKDEDADGSLTPISSTTTGTHTSDDALNSDDDSEEEMARIYSDHLDIQPGSDANAEGDHGHARMMLAMAEERKLLKQKSMEESRGDITTMKRLYHRRKRRLRRREEKVAVERMEEDAGVAGHLDGDTKSRMSRLYKAQMKAERKKSRQEARTKRNILLKKRRHERRELLFSGKALTSRQLAALSIPEGARLLITADDLGDEEQETVTFANSKGGGGGARDDWESAIALRDAADPALLPMDTGLQETLVEGYLPGSNPAMAVIRRRERYGEGGQEMVLTAEERLIVESAMKKRTKKKSSRRSSKAGSKAASRRGSATASITSAASTMLPGKGGNLNFDDLRNQLELVGAGLAPAASQDGSGGKGLTALQKAKLIKAATTEVSDTSTSSNSSRDSEGLPITSYEQAQRKLDRRNDRENRRNTRDKRRDARDWALQSLRKNQGANTGGDFILDATGNIIEVDAAGGGEMSSHDRVREFIQASMQVEGGIGSDSGSGGGVGAGGVGLAALAVGGGSPFTSRVPMGSRSDLGGGSFSDGNSMQRLSEDDDDKSSSIGMDFSTESGEGSYTGGRGGSSDDDNDSMGSAKSAISRTGSVATALHKMTRKDRYEQRKARSDSNTQTKKKRRKKQIKLPQNIQVMKQFSRLVNSLPNLTMDERAIHRRIFYEKLLEVEAAEEREEENKNRIDTVRRRRMREAKRREIQQRKERLILGITVQNDDAVKEGTQEHYNNLLATSSAEGLIRGRPSLIQRLRRSLTRVNREGGRRIVKEPVIETLDAQNERELAETRRRRNPQTARDRPVNTKGDGEEDDGLMETMDLVTRKRRKDMQGRWLDDSVPQDPNAAAAQREDSDITNLSEISSSQGSNKSGADGGDQHDYEQDLMRILFTNPRGFAMAAQEAATIHDALEARGRVKAAAEASAAASERRLERQRQREAARTGGQIQLPIDKQQEQEGADDEEGSEELSSLGSEEGGGEDSTYGGPLLGAGAGLTDHAEKERVEALIRQERSKKLGLLLAVWNSIGEETSATTGETDL